MKYSNVLGRFVSILLVLLALLWSGSNAGAAHIRARDFLKHGQYMLPKNVLVTWNNGDIRMWSAGQEFDVITSEDDSGRIQYIALPRWDGGVDMVDGVIDINPNLMVDVEYNIHKNGAIVAGAMWGNGMMTWSEGCDCSDNTNLNCNTNGCNNGIMCPSPINNNNVCQWTTAVLIWFKVPMLDFTFSK